MAPPYYVYILTNKYHTVLYVGVTNDLLRRMLEHKQKLIPGFTSRYNVDQLVYYEEGMDITLAIAREKQLKGGSRKRKMDLIQASNPEWIDLYAEMLE